MQLQPAGVSFSTRNVKVLTCLFKWFRVYGRWRPVDCGMVRLVVWGGAWVVCRLWKQGVRLAA